MATILGRFQKQPREVLDYFVDYTDWFTNRTDAPSSFAVEADTGIVVEGSELLGNVVKVVLSGGTSGKYKVTVLLTTTASPAIVKEADFVVTVKEV